MLYEVITWRRVPSAAEGACPGSMRRLRGTKFPWGMTPPGMVRSSDGGSEEVFFETEEKGPDGK